MMPCAERSRMVPQKTESTLLRDSMIRIVRRAFVILSYSLTFEIRRYESAAGGRTPRAPHPRSIQGGCGSLSGTASSALTESICEQPCSRRPGQEQRAEAKIPRYLKKVHRIREICRNKAHQKNTPIASRERSN